MRFTLAFKVWANIWKISWLLAAVFECRSFRRKCWERAGEWGKAGYAQEIEETRLHFAPIALTSNRPKAFSTACGSNLKVRWPNLKNGIFLLATNPRNERTENPVSWLNPVMSTSFRMWLQKDYKNERIRQGVFSFLRCISFVCDTKSIHATFKPKDDSSGSPSNSRKDRLGNGRHPEAISPHSSQHWVWPSETKPGTREKIVARNADQSQLAHG